jgi:hypothetical protein
VLDGSVSVSVGVSADFSLNLFLFFSALASQLLIESQIVPVNVSAVNLHSVL